jgi:hypothetical protein
MAGLRFGINREKSGESFITPNDLKSMIRLSASAICGDFMSSPIYVDNIATDFQTLTLPFNQLEATRENRAASSFQYLKVLNQGKSYATGSDNPAVDFPWIPRFGEGPLAKIPQSPSP